MDPLSTPSPRELELRTAMLDIVATRGLDRVTVREVAQAAGVSIGTVQHYFPTKAAMVSAAFDAIVERIRARLAAVALSGDPGADLRRVLRELLPLDAERVAEARVQLAFSAYAATTPDLAAVQWAVLAEIHTGLAAGFAAAGQPPARARASARVALATTDGLAQHAVSAPGLLTTGQLTAALDLALERLLEPWSARAPTPGR